MCVGGGGNVVSDSGQRGVNHNAMDCKIIEWFLVAFASSSLFFFSLIKSKSHSFASFSRLQHRQTCQFYVFLLYKNALHGRYLNFTLLLASFWSPYVPYNFTYQKKKKKCLTFCLSEPLFQYLSSFLSLTLPIHSYIHKYTKKEEERNSSNNSKVVDGG